MSSGLSTDGNEGPLAHGCSGPMDGAVLGPAGPAEYVVVMADDSRHRYVREGDQDDAGQVGYRWVGRVGKAPDRGPP